MKKAASDYGIAWEDYFQYEDGRLLWKVAAARRIKVGTEAGTPSGSEGRLSVALKGTNWYVHRIVWELHNGAIPFNLEVGHVDRDVLNNRIENLRLVTCAENQRNRSIQRNNKSGIAGVTWVSRLCKWQVYINVEGSRKHLGVYPELLEAVACRMVALREYDYCLSHGRLKYAD